MKHIAAAVLALTISSPFAAQAGGLTDPVLEQEIIMEAAKAGSSSSGTTILALFSLFIFAAAVGG